MEKFKPISNTAPNGFLNTIKFYLRFIIDFQGLTVYSDLKKFIKNKQGKLLDVGCGDSPYEHLFTQNFQYTGIDYFGADSFGYNNTKILKFDGINIPLDNESIDTIICTEVLEHTEQPQALVDNMFRVLKKDGAAFITIPWSARFHYIPYDYYRYTPSMLTLIFKNFSEIKISPRGTDITVIVNKISLVFARQISGNIVRTTIAIPVILILSPLLLLLVIIAHASLLFKLGSTEDPLGYTVILKK